MLLASLLDASSVEIKSGTTDGGDAMDGWRIPANEGVSKKSLSFGEPTETTSSFPKGPKRDKLIDWDNNNCFSRDI